MGLEIKIVPIIKLYLNTKVGDKDAEIELNSRYPELVSYLKGVITDI